MNPRENVYAGLVDGRWEVRRASAWSLLRAPEPADFERLVPLLRDPKAAERQAAAFAVKPSLTASLPRQLRFEELWGAATLALLDEPLGAGAWQLPEHAGQILAIPFRIPNALWSLPYKVWHLDYMAPGALRALPGLQLFVCLDRVEARAGATVVARGTHRLIDAPELQRAPAHGAHGAHPLGVGWAREAAAWRDATTSDG